ncbi:mannose-1-phosphate guanylyltransferase/mannose-6-phosphate isomerase [Aestuariirhabdus sp. Z084]|uniref:mannose-1-phosphate guanylyltransferase/mannose-6-phosphate isomerase n=1 Tax=Aestuariirhabdus haliotis TaxID=2918751 RepID=UPI00201B3632|nr:mannose-1-phosphate guanylyltransferase/mannose-6-phosphate isomerase [Aestuariirhabdus haliotis]MCL6414825.1 mannose-1-phosphate guanylyltransferase/mannose-6-phosphate isomerase [Aestuariirhabdus haliotis]MCL6418757.1 mannose-1-phosphate guanylyltransferase/mannose-6-phosphate isomerase [Aestuariirhabdus haliotis]
MIVPVILSGGSGSRLWPLSRESYPKQLIRMLSDHDSMIQQTWRRIADVDDVAPPLIVCNEQHRFTVAEQMRQCGAEGSNIVLEPCARNTAPAIAAAALIAQRSGENPTLLILPADHVIARVDEFHQRIKLASLLSSTGRLVTFGIIADRPETGYGYIKGGAELPEGGLRLDHFVEKPSLERAKKLVASGDYFWNSGMFMFQAQTLINELQQYQPELLKAVEASVQQASEDLDFIRLQEDGFSAAPDLSIDYGLMEHTQKGAVVPADISWSDVGAWDSLADLQPADDQGNGGVGDRLLVDCNNSYVHADNRLVAAVGLDNIIVVETDDAVLIADRAKAQQVKDVVSLLKSEGRKEAREHRTVYRPWGKYEEIDTSERFQVKHIRVNPGASLSLQMHHHRAEHWVVVQGTAKVTCGDSQYLVTENESTYIPLGEQHRLENPGKIPLDLIEVQSGSYLGEDDIVRLDDIYGRTEIINPEGTPDQ